MHIVLFGATGNAGQRIAAEALSRGHQVTGVVRDPAKSPAPDPRIALVQGDATDAQSVARVVSAVREPAAVVSAISPRPNARGLPAPSLAAAVRAIIAGAKQTGVKRIVWVGGAGSLEVAPGRRLMDTPDFLPAWKGEAVDAANALDVFRTAGQDVDWTYFSPAAHLQPGERTGKYRLGGDQLVIDDRGGSTISMEDYAVALVDELETPRHVKQRFTAAY